MQLAAAFVSAATRFDESGGILHSLASDNDLMLRISRTDQKRSSVAALEKLDGSASVPMSAGRSIAGSLARRPQDFRARPSIWQASRLIRPIREDRTTAFKATSMVQSVTAIPSASKTGRETRKSVRICLLHDAMRR